jgi:C4-dicarboxylate-binding protein DctP
VDAPSGCNTVRQVAEACSLLLAVLCWAGAPAALAEPAKLRLGLPIAVDSPTGENIQEFARQVGARTGGEIRIEIQGQDRGYDERGVLSVVRSGAIEIGATQLSQFVRDVPQAGIFLQPFMFNYDALVQTATGDRHEIRELIEQEILRRTNTRVLWWQPYGAGVILSRGVRATNPRAIAARVIGAPDSQMRELIRVCGGAPIPGSPASLIAELRNGAIDAAAADIMNVGEFELWRVADTITDLRHAPSLVVVVINERVWQRLSLEHREIVAELAQDAQNFMWARFATVRAQAYASAVEKGMRIVEATGDDVEAWRACSAPLLESYIERAGESGRKLFMAYGRLRTDPCCREPPPATSFVHP